MDGGGGQTSTKSSSQSFWFAKWVALGHADCSVVGDGDTVKCVSVAFVVLSGLHSPPPRRGNAEICILSVWKASSPVLSNFIHSFTNPTRCCGISGNDRAWMQFDRHVFSILFRAPRKSLHLVFILFQSEYDIKIYSFEAVPRRTYVSRYHLLPLCSFLWSVILCPNDIRHPLPSIIMKSRVIQLETYCDIWSRPISHLRSFPGSSISPGCHLSSEYNV